MIFLKRLYNETQIRKLVISPVSWEIETNYFKVLKRTCEELADSPEPFT